MKWLSGKGRKPAVDLATVSLRGRIFIVFISMITIILAGSGGLLWYSYRIDSAMDVLVSRELVLYRLSQDMELGLANQKGLLTYYLVDGDEKWLQALTDYRLAFRQYIDEARTLPLNERQDSLLSLIAQTYEAYAAAKDEAIENYRATETIRSVSALHAAQREVFFSLLELCRNFREEQWSLIRNLEARATHQSSHSRLLLFGSIMFFLLCSSAFLLLIYRRILRPIRGLALESGCSFQDSAKDEVSSLMQSLKNMMRHVDETQDELEKSRKNLIQAERMAVVGELAAGVAHTIRNPFTSIKMRMFTLARSLDLTEEQQEDLQVMGDEIARIDRIVENFLEFARPPKLRIEPCSAESLIKSVISLLEYRLKKYQAQIVCTTQPDIPNIMVDADRIKEALVNLITNACEAMETAGEITIDVRLVDDPMFGQMAAIAVKDSGAGIPEHVLHRVLTPFFTTKENGSGLGLSIVERIVREHRGRVTISSVVGQGTLCVMELPVQEVDNETNSDNRRRSPALSELR